VRSGILRVFLILATALALAGCASKFRTYNGPEVTRIVVMKADRRMYLMHHDTVLRSFKIDLGFAPDGHKQFEGDGRTPEGRYYIDRRNPNSDFHLSLGISYPNERDREIASSMGKLPGGDIFIHGGPRKGIDRRGPDWTAGCIAVTNREMEDIYAMVREGTPIDIFP
jgi:murein L,D-transpeptidase YafK